MASVRNFLGNNFANSAQLNAVLGKIQMNRDKSNQQKRNEYYAKNNTSKEELSSLIGELQKTNKSRIFSADDALKLRASKAAAVAKTTPIAAPTTRDTMAEQRQREREKYPITTRPVIIPPDLMKARMTSQGA